MGRRGGRQRGRHKAWGGGGRSSATVGGLTSGEEKEGARGVEAWVTKWSAPLERATTLIRISFPSPPGFEVGVILMWV